MTEGIDGLRAAVLGLPVAQVWRGHGSALSLEFGALTPTRRRDGSPGAPKGEIGLMIEWSWRIEDDRAILCGSWSDEELWEPAFARLAGRAVEGLATVGRLPEITLALAGGLWVSSFMTAEGDPAWVLFDRRTPRTLAVRCRGGAIVAERT